MKRLSILVISVLIALAGCDTSVTPATPTPVPPPTTQALTKVTIALGYIPDVQFTPFYVALNRGYYRDEGLDVTFNNGIVTDLIKLLGEGAQDINFAVASGDEIIPARLQGVPVVYVMTWYRQYPVAAASIVGKGPTLKSPADLKGHTVGVPGPFGSTYIGLQALLKAGNLTLNDIQLKSINFTQVPSLTQGQVDVAMVYAANEPVQLRSQKLDVSTLLVADYAKLASNGIATNEKTLKENPELVGKVIRATLKGLNDTISDPTSAFNDALKQVPEAGKNRDLQLQVLQETIKLMKAKPDDPAANQPEGWTDPAVWSATQDFLLDIKIIDKKGDVNSMFSNQFVAPPNQ
jgi:NitT/TauT family transport system substrate-binding protein